MLKIEDIEITKNDDDMTFSMKIKGSIRNEILGNVQETVVIDIPRVEFTFGKISQYRENNSFLLQDKLQLDLVGNLWITELPTGEHYTHSISYEQSI